MYHNAVFVCLGYALDTLALKSCSNFKSVIYEQILPVDSVHEHFSYKIDLRWVPQTPLVISQHWLK